MPPRNTSTATETDAAAAATAAAAAGTDATDPTLVVEAGAASAALAGADTTIVGDQPIPVPVGGPGAGALQVAERSDTAHLRALDREGLADAAGARRGGMNPLFDQRRGLPVYNDPRGRVLGTLDAAAVPGRRYATAARPIAHNNEPYVPGEFIALTFKEFSELVSIGAVMADPWDALEEVPSSAS